MLTRRKEDDYDYLVNQMPNFDRFFTSLSNEEVFPSPVLLLLEKNHNEIDSQTLSKIYKDLEEFSSEYEEKLIVFKIKSALISCKNLPNEIIEQILNGETQYAHKITEGHFIDFNLKNDILNRPQETDEKVQNKEKMTSKGSDTFKKEKEVEIEEDNNMNCSF